MLPFMWNLFKSWRCGEPVTVDDPWGYGNSLEWATSCPPPRHNFTQLPRIRSERPALELQPTHGGAEPTSAATTPRCTADAIREWQLFLRRISPSVSSRTGRSAPPFRRQYPPCARHGGKSIEGNLRVRRAAGSSPDVDLSDVSRCSGTTWPKRRRCYGLGSLIVWSARFLRSSRVWTRAPHRSTTGTCCTKFVPTIGTVRSPPRRSSYTQLWTISLESR
jgi:hypothetical protein